MSLATATATRAELVTLKTAVDNLAIMLRQVVDGSATPAAPGRFTVAQIDTAIGAVTTAISAVNG